MLSQSNIKLLAHDGTSVYNENSCSGCLLHQASLFTYPNGGVISVYWGQSVNEGILAVMQLWTWHSYRHLVMASLCKSMYLPIATRPIMVARGWAMTGPVELWPTEEGLINSSSTMPVPRCIAWWCTRNWFIWLRVGPISLTKFLVIMLRTVGIKADQVLPFIKTSPKYGGVMLRSTQYDKGYI